MVQVRVVALAVDSRAQPVVLLKPILEEPGMGTMLPIWIGAQEATSIFLATEGAQAPRPLSHDLMKTMLEALHADVEKVEVTRIEDGTFYAEITLATGTGRLVLDSRPSDAIALAARYDAPIWVNDDLLQEAGVPDATETEGVVDEEAKLDEFKRFLDDVEPEDFQG
ncbi:bifunctional nuclease family protein [Planctomonas psychrotolerans]|uniref:bifunctional nuclease family protein n=1 Tax=Planctomonas psychrotolerans TaxID=2528712 RepID=UPI0012389565|nr:bifunctional nuclease family protein [Planctomonas psychrotolerans]